MGVGAVIRWNSACKLYAEACFLAKTLDFLPVEGRTHEGISRHPAGYFCSNGQKQKQAPFQYLTCLCALFSEIDQDNASSMLANCASFKLRAKAPIQGRPAMRAESVSMRRKANENRLPSIAVTTENPWPLLSGVGPLRRRRKIEAVRSAQPVLVVSARSALPSDGGNRSAQVPPQRRRAHRSARHCRHPRQATLTLRRADS
jgi:hypothetical protein